MNDYLDFLQVMGRRGIGAELKASYYRQAVRNVQSAAAGIKYDADNEEILFEEHAA